MPQPVYRDTLTQESERRLRSLLHDLPSPVALAGGHAVRLRVQERWLERFGEDYFGSRDIDAAYYVDPAWSHDEFLSSAVAQAPRRLEELGFQRSGAFRFSLLLDDDGQVIDETPRFGIEGIDHHVLSVDPMVTAAHAEARAILGFVPIDEPLLASAFQGGGADPMPEFGGDVWLPATPLLVATKLNSLPNRTKDDKRVKDLCDLYALVAHGGSPMDDIRARIHRDLPDAARLVNHAIRHESLPEALRHLAVPRRDFEAVVGPLALRP